MKARKKLLSINILTFSIVIFLQHSTTISRRPARQMKLLALRS